jgi:sugar lactone lactonase YvrE
MRRLVIGLCAAILLGSGLAGTVSAAPFSGIVTLPGATSAEGIARGAGSTFYVGDLFTGDIYRGDVHAGPASLFIDAPAGRMAAGMKVDLAHHLLFVAGAFTGQAYVYDTRTGAGVAAFQFADPGDGPTMVNDVIVSHGVAWFTDSMRPSLYRVPIGRHGSLGAWSTLTVQGPAADLSGAFNLNGIAAAANGKTLMVSHSGDGTLYTIDPKTGASAGMADADLPNVDGIIFEGGRVWAVQNLSDQVTELRLGHDLSSASVERVLTDPAFEVPTAVARFGPQLAIVNAKFDTGFPPTAPSYEVVVVDRN